MSKTDTVDKVNKKISSNRKTCKKYTEDSKNDRWRGTKLEGMVKE